VVGFDVSNVERKVDINLNEKILKMYVFQDLDIPEFYQAEQIFASIEKRVKSSEFKEFLINKIENIKLDNIDDLRNSIIYLKKKFKVKEFGKLLSKIEDKRKKLKKEEIERKEKLKKFLEKLSVENNR